MNQQTDAKRFKERKADLTKTVCKFLETENKGAMEHMFLDLIGMRIHHAHDLSKEAKEELRAYTTEQMVEGLAALQDKDPALFHRRFRVLCYYEPDYVQEFAMKHELSQTDLVQCLRVGILLSIHAPLDGGPNQSVKRAPLSSLQIEPDRSSEIRLRRLGRQSLLSEQAGERTNGQIAFDDAILRLAQKTISEMTMTGRKKLSRPGGAPFHPTYAQPIPKQPKGFWRRFLKEARWG